MVLFSKYFSTVDMCSVRNFTYKERTKILGAPQDLITFTKIVDIQVSPIWPVSNVSDVKKKKKEEVVAVTETFKQITKFNIDR